MSKLRVAMIGCGEIAQIRYLPALIKMPEISLEALVDKNLDMLEKVANSFNLQNVTKSTEITDILDKIDAAIVTVPPKWHPAICKTVVLAGKHVLVEKPLALNYEGAKEIYDAAAKMKVSVLPLPFNDYPGIKKAAQLVRSGLLGNPVSAQATHVHYAVKDGRQFFQKGLNNVLADVAFYPLSRLIDILGPIIHATGNLVNQQPELNSPDIKANYPETVETAVLSLNFMNGAVATVTVSSSVGGLGTTVKRGTEHSNSFQQFSIFMEKGIIITDGKQKLSVYSDQVIAGRHPAKIEGGVGVCLDDQLATEAESEENSITWSGFRILDLFLHQINLPVDLNKLRQEVHICEVIDRAKQHEQSLVEIPTAKWFCR